MGSRPSRRWGQAGEQQGRWGSGGSRSKPSTINNRVCRSPVTFLASSLVLKVLVVHQTSDINFWSVSSFFSEKEEKGRKCCRVKEDVFFRRMRTQDIRRKRKNSCGTGRTSSKVLQPIRDVGRPKKKAECVLGESKEQNLLICTAPPLQ